MAAHKVDVTVVHSPTLKPFDDETVVRELDTPRFAITLENHSVVGGLLEAVSSALVRRSMSRLMTPGTLPDALMDAGALDVDGAHQATKQQILVHTLHGRLRGAYRR